MSTIEPSIPALPETAGQASAPGWHDQDGRLREMWLQNHTPQQIAEALGRSVPAVMTRAARLGLPRRSAPGRKPSVKTGQQSENATRTAAATRAKPQSQAQDAPQSSLRVCLMCLNKFESAGRHNRICSPCKNSAEYETASTLPDIELPAT